MGRGRRGSRLRGGVADGDEDEWGEKVTVLCFAGLSQVFLSLCLLLKPDRTGTIAEYFSEKIQLEKRGITCR
jgi:hypothetical protein